MIQGLFMFVFNQKHISTLICGVKLFDSKFDLYSKSDAIPDVEAVTPYYEELIAKYCPGELSW